MTDTKDLISLRSRALVGVGSLQALISHTYGFDKSDHSKVRFEYFQEKIQDIENYLMALNPFDRPYFVVPEDKAFDPKTFKLTPGDLKACEVKEDNCGAKDFKTEFDVLKTYFGLPTQQEIKE